MSDTHNTPQLAPELIWRTIDNDAVIVTPRDGRVRVLNGMGSTIWQLLSEGRDLPQITAHLVEYYDVSLEQASTDLQKFITELQDRELIVWEA